MRKAIAACQDSDGKPGDWERSIDVPMRGPGYISYVITDSAFCGGAYPNSATMSIVYDLRTGAPVDWTRLLPPALTGKVALQTGMDGTRMVSLSGKRLYELYLAGYHMDGSADDQAECKDAVKSASGGDAPAMMAWLDAKAGGLAVQFDLVHAVEACAIPVVIPAAALRTEGVQPALLDSILAAHPK